MKLTKEQNEQLERNIQSAEAFYKVRVDGMADMCGAMIRSVCDNLLELLQTTAAYLSQGYKIAENMPCEHKPGFYASAYFLKPAEIQEADLKAIRAEEKKKFEKLIEYERQLLIEREIQRRLALEVEAEKAAQAAILEAKKQAIKEQVLAEMK